jgi:hypothetical protein
MQYEGYLPIGKQCSIYTLTNYRRERRKMTYPFEKIHHIRIAVDDIDEKVKNFESIGIGIKLFFASPFSPFGGQGN